MDDCVRLSRADREALLEVYLKGAKNKQRLQAHIVLLLDDQAIWALIAILLFTSTTTINRWLLRYCDERMASIAGQRAWRAHVREWWLGLVPRWVLHDSPTRWLRALSLDVRNARGIVTRRLSGAREPGDHSATTAGCQAGVAAAATGPKDPAVKLGIICALLRQLPANEIAVCMDEVDINTNPKVGSISMRRGEQAEVGTPGNNEKRYLAGSLYWWTGGLTITEGRSRQGRNTDLFLAHLDDLRRRYRCFRVIHVICDNAKSVQTKRVREYLPRYCGRVVVH